MILECVLPASKTISTRHCKRHLLAIITACITEGRDATTEAVSFTEMDTLQLVVDPAAVGAVIGRFTVGDGDHYRTAIVDRSGDLARALFVDEAPGMDTQEGDPSDDE